MRENSDFFLEVGEQLEKEGEALSVPALAFPVLDQADIAALLPYRGMTILHTLLS